MGGREGGSNAPKKASPRLQECTTAKETQRPFFFFFARRAKEQNLSFFFLLSLFIKCWFNLQWRGLSPLRAKIFGMPEVRKPTSVLFCFVLFCSVLWPGLSSVASLWHSCLFGVGLQGLQLHPDMQGSRSGVGVGGEGIYRSIRQPLTSSLTTTWTVLAIRAFVSLGVWPVS